MLAKQEFIKMKKEIKEMCLPNVIDLCEKVGLTEYEKSILICVNQNMSRVATAFKLSSSEWLISTTLRTILTKIKDYREYTHVD